MKRVVYDETDLQMTLLSFLECVREIDSDIATLDAIDAEGTVIESASLED